MLDWRELKRRVKARRRTIATNAPEIDEASSIFAALVMQEKCCWAEAAAR